MILYSLRNVLLKKSEDDIEEWFVDQYHNALNLLEKEHNYNLDAYKITKEDRSPGYIKIRGFLESTATGSSDEVDSEWFYKKDKLLMKINMAIQILAINK